MAELLNQDKIMQPLQPTLNALLDDTISASAASDAKLISAVLYGSASGKHYMPGRSDINVFMVFDRVDIGLLTSLRETFARHFKKLKANPVVLDAEYMKGSIDVFPMEFLEWKERSIVFYGDNLLSNVEIRGENLRLSIEENLRGKRLRLVQTYFEFDPRARKFMPFLLTTIPNFVVVGRNILRLLGAPVAQEALEMFGALEQKTCVQLKTFKRLLQIRTGGLRIGDREVDILFKDYLAEIDSLIVFIDSFKAGDAKC